MISVSITVEKGKHPTSRVELDRPTTVEMYIAVREMAEVVDEMKHLITPTGGMSR